MSLYRKILLRLRSCRAAEDAKAVARNARYVDRQRRASLTSADSGTRARSDLQRDMLKPTLLSVGRFKLGAVAIGQLAHLRNGELSVSVINLCEKLVDVADGACLLHQHFELSGKYKRANA